MKCNICSEIIEGHGNNPWPFDESEKDRCCDSCNMNFVIPARLKLTTYGGETW